MRKKKVKVYVKLNTVFSINKAVEQLEEIEKAHPNVKLDAHIDVCNGASNTKIIFF